MNSVMISIRPYWVQKILSGEKTLEIRKTRPKIEPPFKCYIYCTKAKNDDEDVLIDHGNGKYTLSNGGKVVAEFICDRANRYVPWAALISKNATAIEIKAASCMTGEEIANYADGKNIYGWHISDLKVYDRPRSLRSFMGTCAEKVHTDRDCGDCKKLLKGGEGHCPHDPMRRAPQSWCYIEEPCMKEAEIEMSDVDFSVCDPGHMEKVAKELEHLGVSITNENGGLKSILDVMREIGQKMKEVEENAGKCGKRIESGG